MLKAVFDLAEHQGKATNGLGYKLTLTKKSNDAVLNKSEQNDIARNEIKNIHCYIPHYTPSISLQGISSKQILYRTHTEFRYNERSVFMKDVISQKYGLSNQDLDKKLWFLLLLFVIFNNKIGQTLQNSNNDTF